MEGDEQEESVANRQMVSVDTVENIFRFFNAYELSCAMKVCRLWRDVARREFARRRSPEILFLRDFCLLHLDETFPYHEIMHTHAWTSRHCARLIRMMPQISITFCRVTSATPHTIHGHLLRAFETCDECFFLQRLVYQSSANPKFFAINVRRACTTVNNQFRNITTLFLPQLRESQIYLCWLSYEFGKAFTKPNRPFPSSLSDLYLQSERKNYCLMLFESRLYDNQYRFRGRSYRQFRENFFRALSSRYRQGIAIWGGRTTFYAPSSSITGNPLFAGLEISGENLRFYSLHLSSLWCDTIETNNKLARFKSLLQLRSQTLGLLLYHHSILDHRNLMKVTFPTIKFIYIQIDEPITVYGDRQMTIFSVDSMEPGECPDFRRPETDSAILIITYD